MTTEHIDPSALDAAKPEVQPAPPAHMIPADLIPAHALERIEHLLSQEEKDALTKAQIAGRDKQRAERQKAKEESAASSKRAEEAVKEVIARGEQERHEENAPVALTVPPLLTATQIPIAEGYTQDMGEIAAEMNMPAEEAQTLLDFVIGGATETLEGLNTANTEEVITHLHNVYGETAAETIITGAQAGYKKLPPSVQAWLDQPNEFGERLSNHPAVLSMLSLWNGGYSKLTPEAAARELAQHRATKEYQAGDRFKLDKVRLLTMIATRGQSEEMAMPAKAAPAAKSAVQQRIEAIRKDPGYTSMDSRVRKPLVDEMSRLMAQIHGGA